MTSLLKVCIPFLFRKDCTFINNTYTQGIGPRVMLVEEAGQVLEAHVLGSLVESVQHLIMIGDPLQLRPNLNNYRQCPFRKTR